MYSECMPKTQMSLLCRVINRNRRGTARAEAIETNAHAFIQHCGGNTDSKRMDHLPRTSACTSCVPSYVLTDSRLSRCRMT